MDIRMTTTPADIYLQQPNPLQHRTPGSHCRHPSDHLYRVFDDRDTDLGWMICYLCGATGKVTTYDAATKQVTIDKMTNRHLREGT